jgi:hypothetical protein
MGSQDAPGQPPERFQVRSGFLDSGEPFIEIRDNLVMQEITLPLPLALQKAAEMNMHVAQLMMMAAQQAQHQKNGIVRADGRPV